ncbi:MAG: type II toxin-antitoxin system YafQ family toxin [Chitinivibrionia bacterium]|nr:type II toxin-antitoxin system YafQ family toxin [Chitinivibrionia bacterium]
MLNLQLSNQFKKDYKKIVRQGKNVDDLWLVIEKLLKNEKEVILILQVYTFYKWHVVFYKKVR